MDWSRVVSCHLLFSPFSLYIIKQKAVDNTRALNWWTSVSFSSYDGCDSLRRPILGTMPISSLLLWAIYSGQEEQITSNFSVYTAYSFEMGDKCSTVTVLWDVASRISSRQFVALLCSSYVAFFSVCLVCVHVVHPYSSIDAVTAWKKSRFILSDWLDFGTINNLQIDFWKYHSSKLNLMMIIFG